MAKQQAPPLTMFVYFEGPSGGFGHSWVHVRGRLGYFNEQEQDHEHERPRLADSVGLDECDVLQALEVSCQGNWKDGALEDTRLYAWQTLVRGLDLDWGRAAIAARKLELLRRKLAQMDQREGRCERFSLYLMRTARALGCRDFAIEKDPKARQLSGERYARCGLADGERRIDWQIQKLWIEPAQAAAVAG